MENDLEAVERLITSLPPEKCAALLNMPAVRARLGAKIKWMPKQLEAQALLRSEATHCFLYGGARSGKSLVIIAEIIGRALTAKSRHVVLRHRFSHLRASIINDTLPRAMDLVFPGAVAGARLDKTDWYYELPNGSQIYFAGLDESDRVERILGTEYVSMFFNEASQIPWASRATAITRLAQVVPGLARKSYTDANPPSRRHWCHSLFIDRIDPIAHQPLANPSDYAAMRLNPVDNAGNLAADYLQELENLDEARRRRFWLGEFSDDSEDLLFTGEMVDKARHRGELPQMVRVVVAIDPSGCKGLEDKRSDEVGIVIVGLGVDGISYILEDVSGRFGPEQWASTAVSAFDRWQADACIAEQNYGGPLVEAVLKTASTERGLAVPVRLVTATRGKAIRAEPVAHLFTQGKVKIAGRFQQLEDQLTSFTSWGYAGDRSPDRADAAIWAITSLVPAISREGRRHRPPPRVVLAYAGAKKHYGAPASHAELPQPEDSDFQYIPRDQRPWPPKREPRVIRTRPR